MALVNSDMMENSAAPIPPLQNYTLDLRTLTQTEEETLRQVLERDAQEMEILDNRISLIRKEIQDIRIKGALVEGDHQNTMCARCKHKFWLIPLPLTDRGVRCIKCKFRICARCRFKQINKTWLCVLCLKYRQEKVLSGEWMFKAPVVGLFGSDLMRASLRDKERLKNLATKSPHKPKKHQGGGVGHNKIQTNAKQDKDRASKKRWDVLRQHGLDTMEGKKKSGLKQAKEEPPVDISLTEIDGKSIVDGKKSIAEGRKSIAEGKKSKTTQRKSKADDRKSMAAEKGGMDPEKKRKRIADKETDEVKEKGKGKRKGHKDKGGDKEGRKEKKEKGSKDKGKAKGNKDKEKSKDKSKDKKDAKGKGKSDSMAQSKKTGGKKKKGKNNNREDSINLTQNKTDDERDNCFKYNTDCHVKKMRVSFDNLPQKSGINAFYSRTTSRQYVTKMPEVKDTLLNDCLNSMELTLSESHLPNPISSNHNELVRKSLAPTLAYQEEPTSQMCLEDCTYKLQGAKLSYCNSEIMEKTSDRVRETKASELKVLHSAFNKPLTKKQSILQENSDFIETNKTTLYMPTRITKSKSKMNLVESNSERIETEKSLSPATKLLPKPDVFEFTYLSSKRDPVSNSKLLSIDKTYKVSDKHKPKASCQLEAIQSPQIKDIRMNFESNKISHVKSKSRAKTNDDSELRSRDNNTNSPIAVRHVFGYFKDIFIHTAKGSRKKKRSNTRLKSRQRDLDTCYTKGESAGRECMAVLEESVVEKPKSKKDQILPLANLTDLLDEAPGDSIQGLSGVRSANDKELSDNIDCNKRDKDQSLRRNKLRQILTSHREIIPTFPGDEDKPNHDFRMCGDIPSSNDIKSRCQDTCIDPDVHVNRAYLNGDSRHKINRFYDLQDLEHDNIKMMNDSQSIPKSHLQKVGNPRQNRHLSNNKNNLKQTAQVVNKFTICSNDSLLDKERSPFDSENANLRSLSHWSLENQGRQWKRKSTSRHDPPERDTSVDRYYTVFKARLTLMKTSNPGAPAGQGSQEKRGKRTKMLRKRNKVRVSRRNKRAGDLGSMAMLRKTKLKPPMKP